MSFAGHLHAIRYGSRSELAVAAAVVVGIVATAGHWLGLVVAGALLGVVASSTGRALVLGCYFGFFVLVAYGIVLIWYGVLGAVAGAFPLSVGLVAVSVLVPTATAAIVRYGTPVATTDR